MKQEESYVQMAILGGQHISCDDWECGPIFAISDKPLYMMRVHDLHNLMVLSTEVLLYFIHSTKGEKKTCTCLVVPIHAYR